MLSIKGASRTLNYMLRQNRGCRCESYSGSGVRKLREILDFEIEELRNMDIPATILKLHHPRVSHELRKVIENENDPGEYSFDIINWVMAFASNYFKVPEEELCGIWLTTKANVIKRYGIDFDECNLPDDALPISDLGKDGALFVYLKRNSIDIYLRKGA